MQKMGTTIASNGYGGGAFKIRFIRGQQHQ